MSPRVPTPFTTSTTSEQPSARLSKSFLSAVALGTMIAPLNATMVAVVLSDISDEFSLSLRAVSWIVIAYLIGMAVVQPIAGKLGDLVGRRGLYLGALLAFGAASAAAALVPNFYGVLGARVAMALSGAVAIPNGIALLRQYVPAKGRGAAFGIVGSANGLAVFAGPLVGGAVAALFEWRAIFWLNIPIIALTWYLAYRTFPKTPRNIAVQFDFAGATLLTGFICCFALMAYFTGAGSATTPIALGLAGVVMTVAFLWWERRASEPLVRLSMLRIRSYASALEVVSVSNAVIFGIFFAVPLFLKEIRGLDSAQAGYALSAFAIPVMFVPAMAGRWADRWGRRRPAFIGGVIAVMGMAPLMFVEPSWSPVIIGLCLVVVGLGFSMQFPAVQASSVDSVRAQDAGMASGVYSTSRYIGTIMGTAVAAAILGSGDAVAQNVTIGKLHAVFIFVTACGVAGALGCLGLRGKDEVHHEERHEAARAAAPLPAGGTHT